MTIWINLLINVFYASQDLKSQILKKYMNVTLVNIKLKDPVTSEDTLIQSIQQIIIHKKGDVPRTNGEPVDAARRSEQVLVGTKTGEARIGLRRACRTG